MSLLKYLDRSKSQKDDDIVQEKSVLSLEEELADLQVTLASGQDGLEDTFQSPCITRSLNERSAARNMVITELELQPQDERIEIDMAAMPSTSTQEVVISRPNDSDATKQHTSSWVRANRKQWIKPLTGRSYHTKR